METSQPTRLSHGEGDGRCYTRVVWGFLCLMGMLWLCLVLPRWVARKSFHSDGWK